MDEKSAMALDASAIMGAAGQQASQNAAAQYYLEEQNQALAEKQLDVKKIRRECYYLLKQYIWNPNQGQDEWAENKNAKRIFTEGGVDRIMQVIHFYINESNLLSNFDEPTINYLMLKFITEINDLVLMKYETLFVQPTFEECKQILMDRIDERKKLKMFAAEMIGVTLDEKAVKKELLAEVENRIEYEMNKIKTEQRKERLREYSLIITQLEAIVLGALNRAWKGEERGSLRRHTQMLEMLGVGGQPMTQEQGGMFKWLKK